MSGVVVNGVGFFLSHTADMIHAAMQMHITRSSSKHLHRCSYLRHIQHFLFRNTDSHGKDGPKLRSDTCKGV